jgi:hypothetical protein
MEGWPPGDDAAAATGSVAELEIELSVESRR